MRTLPNENRTDFGRLNMIVTVILPFSWLLWLMTLGITEKLFIPFAVLNLLLGIFHFAYRKKGRFKGVVIALRVAVFTVIAIVLAVAPVIGMGFNESKAMYPVKRFVFGHGVRFGENTNIFMPKKLPEECEEYCFVTQLIFPAQDYSPHACLLISCNEEYISEYTDNAVKKGFVKKQSALTFDEFLEEKNLTAEDFYDNENADYRDNIMRNYLHLPYHVRWCDRLSPDAEVYYNDIANCGFASDKTSGIMIFWS